MNPAKHRADLEAEQIKYFGCCLYHLTKSHCTDDCHVKKECNKLLASKRTHSATNPSQHSATGTSPGNLRHITEETYEDAVEQEDTKDDSSVHSHNDTNKSDLLYFARVSKHYLRLVKTILGVGTVQCVIGSQILTIENVRYIPTLSESIYSLFIHVQQPNHGIHSSYDQGLFLKFQTFQTKAIIGRDDLYLDAIPTIDHLLPTSTNVVDS